MLFRDYYVCLCMCPCVCVLVAMEIQKMLGIMEYLESSGVDYHLFD